MYNIVYSTIYNIIYSTVYSILPRPMAAAVAVAQKENRKLLFHTLTSMRDRLFPAWPGARHRRRWPGCWRPGTPCGLEGWREDARVAGGHLDALDCLHWVAVKERKLSYQNSKTIFFGIYPYYGNLN